MGTTRRKLPATVISDPHILGGTPVIRGTRVPAALIARMVREGTDTFDILRHYPSIDLDGIRAAVEWAEAQPANEPF
jgi:uncharacterized protein (DUF433 family)